MPRLKKATLPLAPFVDAVRSGSPRQQAAAAVALGRLGQPQAAKALLGVPFTKPDDRGDSAFTQKDTLKGNRFSQLSLAVRPGDELRFHLFSTDSASAPVQVALAEASFTLANGEKVSLSGLTPTSGRAALAAAPEPSAAPASKKGQKGQRGPSGPSVVIDGPPLVAYTVPANAVSFSARARNAAAGQETSLEFFASTGRSGENRPQSFSPRHATPNSAIVVPHLAVHAIVRLRAVDDCLAAVGTPAEDLALWALSQLHEERSVDGLLAKLAAGPAPALRLKLLTTLARLYQQEAPWDGKSWWTTRPDTRGPYYRPTKWNASPRIAVALESEAARATTNEQKDFLARLNDTQRLGLASLGTREPVAPAAEKAPAIDLARIASKSGAIATTPLEDVLLAVEKLKPNPERGAALFTQQGCVACHALQPGGAALGPFMGQIGAIMNPAQIATAILRPSDTISQGFQTVSLTLKDGTTRTGFASETTPEKIVLRDMTGAVTTIATSDVKEEKHLPMSMMPEGLANALSLEDFAALVRFLAEKK